MLSQGDVKWGWRELGEICGVAIHHRTELVNLYSHVPQHYNFTNSYFFLSSKN